MDADLVLEGGGVKGIGLVGAVSALREADYQFGGRARVAGTSAGAIVGALLAAGMPAARLEQVMREVDYRRFRDRGPLGPLSSGISLLRRLGLYKSDYLHGWIDEQLRGCNVRTFGNLRIKDSGSALPPERSYRLVVVVSDVTRGRMVRLPWDYHHYGLDPDRQSVADAVRASASIPFFFQPTYLRPSRSRPASLCTDGGMLSNFPVDLFDRRDGRAPRWPTFGIKLSGRRPSEDWEPNGTTIRSPLSLAFALLGTMASAHDRLLMDLPGVNDRTVFVDTMGVKATDFDLGPEVQTSLFEQGRAAAQGFLHGWNFDAYVARFYQRPETAA